MTGLPRPGRSSLGTYRLPVRDVQKQVQGEERRGGTCGNAEKQSAWHGEPHSGVGPGPTLTFRTGGPRLWAGTSYTWEGSVGNEVRAGLGIVQRALGRQRRAKGRRRHCGVHRSCSKLPSYNEGSPNSTEAVSLHP